MLPKFHILISFLTALILVELFHLPIIYSFLLFCSAVLIDVDHYLLYVYKQKNLSLKKAYWYFYKRDIEFCKLSHNQKKRYKADILIFHNIEFLILVFLLALFYYPVIFVFWGLILHMFLDILDMKNKKIPIYIKTSLIYNYMTNQNKKEFKIR